MPEILIIGFILMVLFGPSQLPKIGRSLGQTIKELKNVGKELQSSDDEKDA